MKNQHTPTVLTIAGSDPYGGAGIQADLKTIHALGGYGLSAITALTAQNSQGVAAVYPTDPEALKIQLHTLLEDIQVDAVKIGMLANTDLIEVVADTLRQFEINQVVLDTVLVSSSGKPLLEAPAVETLVEHLFPLATVITPNLPETNHLLKAQFVGDEIDSMAQGLFELSAQAAILKGGHRTDRNQSTDVLVQTNQSPIELSSPRILTTHTHGTGCTFSSALATSLAQGKPLEESFQQAKHFMQTLFLQSDALKLPYLSQKTARKEPLLHLKKD